MNAADNSFLAPRRDLKYVVLGAGGFVGGAMVERLHRSSAQVLPVMRRAGAGGALLARFGLKPHIADVVSRESLEGAIAGADIVFHCVTGDRAAITDGLAKSLSAAQRAGVKRFIYLSSTVVHGFRPKTALDELSPFDPPAWSEYARSKAAAEKIIAAWRGGPETVVLRPAIIYGPRGRDWSEAPARQIAAGTAYLVEEGRGYMNDIHIAHLLDAMLLAAHHPAAAKQVYTLQDGFGLRWHDYYRSLCTLLGANIESVPVYTLEEIRRRSSRITKYRQWVRTTPSTLRSAVFHEPLKSWLKQAPGFETVRRLTPVNGTASTNGRNGHSPGGEIVPELSVGLLHTYPQPVVDAKIRTELGFAPRLSFDETLEGLRRWYRFLGLAR